MVYVSIEGGFVGTPMMVPLVSLACGAPSPAGKLLVSIQSCHALQVGPGRSSELSVTKKIDIFYRRVERS